MIFEAVAGRDVLVMHVPVHVVEISHTIEHEAHIYPDTHKGPHAYPFTILVNGDKGDGWKKKQPKWAWNLNR